MRYDDDDGNAEGDIVRQFIALGCLGLAALFASQVEAAPKKLIKRVPARVAPAVSPTEVLAGQLFINSYEPGENLVTACRQSSFKNLAVALNMNFKLLTREKSEYETTEDYRSRVMKLTEAMNARDTLICQPLDDNEDLQFTYNADSETFEGSFSLNQNVWRDVKQLGSYRSKTAMGAAATVKSSLEIEYDLSLDEPSALKRCLAGGYSTYRFRVHSPRSTAPRLKASGYLVYLGSLAPPFIGASEQTGSPTLDSPYDVYTSSLTVHLRPKKLVVVDGAGVQAWVCSTDEFTPNQAATPLTGNIVTPDNYPSSALRKEEEGIVAFSATISPEGKVVTCQIQSSSGSQALDDATCNNVSKLRFIPATDAAGKPVEGTYTGRQTWKIN